MKRLAVVVESGIDVRMVDSLSTRFELSLLIRPAFGDKNISQPLERQPAATVNGPVTRPAFFLFVFRWLLAHKNSHDAVMVQNEGIAALAANFARLLTGKPTMLLICSPTVEYFRCKRLKRQIRLPSYLVGYWVLRLTRSLNSVLASCYIVISRHLASQVRPGKRVELIPVYGVDTKRFHPVSPDQKRALRQRIGIPEDTSVIFFSSRVAPEKDAETLVEAAALIAAGGFSFLLMNASGGFDDFRRLAASRGLETYVRACDAVHPIHELPAYYQASDLCVQVSLEEGLGFSPLEALACQVPVVATRVGGLRDTIVDGVTGLTVPARDAADLADKLLFALEHPAEMHAMAMKGREMVETDFEASACFDRLVALVESVT